MKNCIKKLSIFGPFLFTLSISNLSAQEAEQTYLKKSNHPVFVKVHPFSLGFGVEYGVSEKLNVGALGSFYNYSLDKNASASSSSLGISSSWFATSNQSDSGYLKGIIEYTRYSAKSKDEDSGKESRIKNNSLSGSALIGYQWVYDSGIMLNTGIGMQIVKNTIDSDKKIKGTGILPAGEFAVGFRF